MSAIQLRAVLFQATSVFLISRAIPNLVGFVVFLPDLGPDVDFGSWGWSLLLTLAVQILLAIFLWSRGARILAASEEPAFTASPDFLRGAFVLGGVVALAFGLAHLFESLGVLVTQYGFMRHAADLPWMQDHSRVHEAWGRVVGRSFQTAVGILAVIRSEQLAGWLCRGKSRRSQRQEDEDSA